MPDETDSTPEPPPPEQPTLIGGLAPDEMFARGMQSVKMTSGTAGAWQPPTIEEAARLFPGYEVLKLLGRGGMGAVYQARQVELDRLVAIKLLPLEISVDKDFADRFRREARAMAKLNHPNIITVFDFGTTSEGHLFFVMEYVEGANLADLIHQVGLTSEQSLAIVEQVCTALAYAHGKGIVHRDIKPANVMIDTESQVKVADFGLARLTDPSAEQYGHTMTGTVMGTPDYMAPEQMKGMNVDHRADIYSLGVMVYEMLCREVPRGAFEPPSVQVGCDPRIDPIVIKAMQPNPDRRYQSTQEMKADVVAVRTPLPVAPETKPKPPLPKPPGVVGTPRRGVLATDDVSAEGGRRGSARPSTNPLDSQPPPRPSLPTPETAVMQAIPLPKPAQSKPRLYAGIATGLVVLAAMAFLVPKLQLGHAPGPGSSASSPHEAGASPTDAFPSQSLGTRDGKVGAGSPVSQPPLVPSATSDRASPSTATKDSPFENTLGMKFVPVPGTKVLFSVWDTRVQDYAAYAGAKKVDDLWTKADKDSAPIGRELNHPVVAVNWEDAQAFCQWLTNKEQAEGKLPKGMKYRLPTDEEWSAAVELPPESGTTPMEKNEKNNVDFPWGKEWPPKNKVGNYADEAFHAKFPLNERAKDSWNQNQWIEGYNDGYAATSPVGSFPANAYGLYDMGGNVLQWCEDWFDASHKDRVLRGASWDYSERYNLLSSRRIRAVPTNRVNHYGFRCVVEPAPSTVPATVIPTTATKDLPFENTLGMKFVPVPILGGPTGGKPVLFSVWDTRVQDYAAFVKETKREWPKPDFEQDSTHPVVTVSWEDAQIFCQWLTAREQAAGRLAADWSYRLPSDHEWSCAAGNGAREDPAGLPREQSRKINEAFPWGTQWPPPENAGNYASEELKVLQAAGRFTDVKAVIPGYSDGYANTSPVGSFAANEFGLFDMSGNIFQWCDDWMDKDQKLRVRRGSSWYSSVRGFLQFSYRESSPPAVRSHGCGFRCVLSKSEPPTQAVSDTPADATKDAPFENTLGMKFVPVPGTKVLFSVWDTRVQDYAAYARLNKVDSSWQSQQKDGVPVSREPDYPVVGVSSEDAQAFCQWLTEKETAEGKLPPGSKYRLPTDEEWSWAVGLPPELGMTPAEKNGRNRVDFPWGREYPPGGKVGNYADETFHAKFPLKEDGKDEWDKDRWIEGYTDGYATTSPVGSFPANVYGLFDMGGNVQQWCEDWYDKNQNRRVLRGASWHHTSRGDQLSSQRSPAPPSARNDHFGFRCVLVPASSAPSAAAGPVPVVSNMLPPAVTDGQPKGNGPSRAEWVDVVWDKKNTYNGSVTIEGGRLHLTDFATWNSAKMPAFGEMRNGALRFRVRGRDFHVLLRNAGQKLGLRVDFGGTHIVLYDGSPEKNPPFGGIRHLVPVRIDASGEIEFQLAVVGRRFYGWRDGVFLGGQELPEDLDNPGSVIIQARDAVISAARLVNLDHVPETEALPLLGLPATYLSTASSSAAVPATATKERGGGGDSWGTVGGRATPFVNTLGMKFVPVPGTKVLFSVWDTRVQDYAAYTRVNKVDSSWQSQQKDGVPVSREPDYPVVGVSWEDAQAFCQWLTQKEQAEGKLPQGLKYRPPTDEEWSRAVGLPPELGTTPAEKATKDSADYPWGKDYPPVNKLGNYADEAFHAKFPPNESAKEDYNKNHWIEGYDDGYATTSPVGSFPANGYGLYDMGGNVWQWCEDWFDASHKGCVLRGASWSRSGRYDLKSSARNNYEPTARSCYAGFRCVLAPVDVSPALVVPPATATKDSPFENTLGMKFAPVPGTKVLFSVWDTRVQDYAAYAQTNKVDDLWTREQMDGVPIGRELNHPVVGVSWEDAQGFCQWLTEKEIAEGKLPKGLKYRLPTDEEWSIAVGLPPESGTTPAERAWKNGEDFPWGKDYPPRGKVGNYADESFHAKFPLNENAKEVWDQNHWIEGYTDGYATTSPVGSFPANAYGLYDMGGNVYQWCEDRLDASHEDRALRGGSWNSSARGSLLSSNRVYGVPTRRYNGYGFRCVLAPVDVRPAPVATPATATKETPFVNTLGMRFVPVPGMKVLFSVWDARMQDYAAYAQANKVDDSWAKRDMDGVPVGGALNHPVVGVSWEDAQGFCQWLTEKEIAEGKLPQGMKYRLPTDEEWSMAVGLPAEQGATPAEKNGKNALDFPWGIGFPPTKMIGNYADETFHAKFPLNENAKENWEKNRWIEGYTDGYATTSPVGSFPANAYGLYDMGGNVWQWCEDWFDATRQERVLRGASWDDFVRQNLLSSLRIHEPPGLRSSTRGFRCVLAAAP